jgi:hypothetical protein
MTSPADTSAARPLFRVVLATAVLPLTVAAVGSGLIWAWRDTVPSPVAVHWGLDGTADRFSSVGAVVGMLLGLGVLFATMTTVVAVGSRNAPTISRMTAATGAGVTGFVTALMVASLADQRGLADAANADLGVGVWIVALATAAGLGFLAALLVPGAPASSTSGIEADGHTDGLRVALAPGERVVWSRSVASDSVAVVVMFGAVGVTAVAAVVTGMWPALLVPAVLLLLILIMFSIRVTVDRRGLTVRGSLGRPRWHTPLEEIRRAGVVDVRPIRDFGGYGYRIAISSALRGTTGFVLRGGPALILDHADGRRSLVVVDDAETAAGLLNELAARSGARDDDRPGGLRDRRRDGPSGA